jgi:hypothetical protein
MSASRFVALYSTTTPLVDNGPYLIEAAGADDPVSSVNVLVSTDPSYTTTIAVGTQYECNSDDYISITGASNTLIDTGDLHYTVRIAAWRMTGETQDEFRIGAYFYDTTPTLLTSELSAVLGTSAGLGTNTLRDFSATFAIPTTARSIVFRIVSIKRNSTAAHARLKFYNPRGSAVITQDSAFADTHPTILDAVARDYWGFTDGDIEASAIARLTLDNQGLAGFYDASPNETRLDWARKWLADITSVPLYSPSAQFAPVQIRDTPATHDILPKHIIGRPYTVNAPDQHKAHTIEYARNYTIQNADTLAGAISDPDSIYYDPDLAAFVAVAYRNDRKVSADVGIDTDDALGAVDSRSSSYFADLDGADLELIRKLNLLAPDKQVWVFELIDYQLEIRICDTARVTYPRWRFTTPRTGIILNVTEQSAKRTTTIYWWG